MDLYSSHGPLLNEPTVKEKNLEALLLFSIRQDLLL
jgi:hypothetical protein